jgi:hypothetical protein
MKILAAVAGFLAYCAVAGFLCAAAIVNPNLNDTEQFVWCAIACGWGPLLLFVLFCLANLF